MKKLSEKDQFRHWNEAEHRFDIKYKFPLHRNSIVFDVGAYVGDWSFEIFRRYKCNIFAFEPVFTFYHQAHHKLNNEEVYDASNVRIKVLNYGLGGSDRWEDIVLNDDASSIFEVGDECDKESIEIRDIISVMEDFGFREVHLLKLNAEGSEYEILERIIEKGWLSRFQFLQIQFHKNVDDHAERRDKIREALRETHKLNYDYEWFWESWTRK